MSLTLLREKESKEIERGGGGGGETLTDYSCKTIIHNNGDDESNSNPFRVLAN